MLSQDERYQWADIERHLRKDEPVANRRAVTVPVARGRRAAMRDLYITVCTLLAAVAVLHVLTGWLLAAAIAGIFAAVTVPVVWLCLRFRSGMPYRPGMPARRPTPRSL